MPGPYTYYVATAAGGGDNSHNGLYPTDIGGANGPWLTLANAATHMAAGDTLYIRGGTYQEATTWNSDGTEANPITITNYPDENPIIDGNNMTIPADEMAWIMDFHGDWYNISNLEQSNSGGGGIVIRGDNCTVYNCYVHQNWRTGIIAIGNNALIDTCQVWRCSRIKKIQG
jgi:hypothetical protein